MAILSKISKGFYTDGENVYSKMYGRPVVWQHSTEESINDVLGTLFQRMGNTPAYVTIDKERKVSPVKPGQTFCDGEIVVIDKNHIEILNVSLKNAVYSRTDCLLSYDGYTEKRKVVEA